MAYSAYTQQAAKDSQIPLSCIYNLSAQPAGSGFMGGTPSSTGGRIGFRVDHSACGTGTKYTNGLYPRLYDDNASCSPPTLSLAHHHLLWKSRLAGPFVSVWRSWTRALRWARYLRKKGCTEIMVHVIDLDAIPPEHTIYDANFIVQELHRLGRAKDLDAKNHWEELLILNGVHESVGAVIGSLPAGSDNLKIPSNFANVLVPREVHEIVVDIWEKAMAMSDEAHRVQQQQKGHEESFSSSASSASITPVPVQRRFAATVSHDWAESDSGYYSPSTYSSSPSSTTGSLTTPSLSHSRSFSGSTASTLFTGRTYSVSSSNVTEEGEGEGGKDDGEGPDSPLKTSSSPPPVSPGGIVAEISKPARSAIAVSNPQQKRQPESFLPASKCSTTSTLFDTLLSRLYSDMHLRRGHVDSFKLMELVIAMCTDFSSASSPPPSNPAHNAPAQPNTEAKPDPSTVTSTKPPPKLNPAIPPWRQQNKTCVADLKRKDSMWTNALSSYNFSPVHGRGTWVSWRGKAEEEC
ncbi:hypothetical protein CERZMDRAFT_87938 [Cercospora zeae-maydis SCOH1-5]|uniref:DUF7587 domain-containing protein n=1 Tax=Cercospora zeae-maydis SCOH1-5 TaxID=717836 RepID=A0A6A6F2P6_9PEZI|nr:hypothetical protein CERZMDRAFT_87938 [Cercospora zeae-maydis SCOH1-5]